VPGRWWGVTESAGKASESAGRVIASAGKVQESAGKMVELSLFISIFCCMGLVPEIIKYVHMAVGSMVVGFAAVFGLDLLETYLERPRKSQRKMEAQLRLAMAALVDMMAGRLNAKAPSR